MSHPSLSILGAVALASLFGSLVSAQETYTYSGNPFDTLEAPWTSGDGISGQFTIPAPLDPWLLGDDISGRLQSFSFSDGVNTRTLANTSICAFNITTSGSGAIIGWQISLRTFPVPPSGQSGVLMDTTGFVDQAATYTSNGVACSTVFGFDSFAAVFNSPGTWTSTVTTTPDPAVYDFEAPPFTQVESPNSAGDAVAGTVTFDGSLPPLRPLADILPAVTAFSFTDGTENFDAAGSLCLFELATDVWGVPSDWRIGLVLDPDAPGGTTQRFLSITPARIEVLTGLSNETCGADFPTAISSVDERGSWSSDRFPPLESTIYDYVGRASSGASGAGQFGDRTIGFVELDRPLPDDVARSAVGHAVTALAFGDSLQSRSLADTGLCQFELGTDAGGRIDDWRLVLRESPKPATGTPQGALLIDVGGDASAIQPAGSTLCATTSATDSQTTQQPGFWDDAADLGVAVRNGRSFIDPLDPAVWTIPVVNLGTESDSATVTASVPIGIGDMQWECVAAGGAACSSGGATVTGAVDETISMPPGTSAEITVTGNVIAPEGDPITMSALVIGARPADPELVNNEAEDTDPTGLFIDSFEVPEP